MSLADVCMPDGEKQSGVSNLSSTHLSITLVEEKACCLTGSVFLHIRKTSACVYIYILAKANLQPQPLVRLLKQNNCCSYTT